MPLNRLGDASRWLARLTFSFFILAAVLGWEGYQASTGRRPGVPQWRATVYMFAAGAFFLLGSAGVRARHRPYDDAPGPNASPDDRDSGR